MKKILLAIICALPVCAAPCAGADTVAPFDTQVFSAMRAELARNGSRLKADKYPLPYFLAYTVTRMTDFETQASFGATVRDSVEDRAIARVELRVGDYSFDNSNFIKGFGDNNGFLGWTDRDGAYAPVRRSLWELSNNTYNAAVQALAKKHALATTKNLSDKPEDFSRSTPTVFDGGSAAFTLDRRALAEAARKASAVFRNYPDIMVSDVALSASLGERGYVNSEGSAVRGASAFSEVEFNAETMSSDGLPLRRSRSVVYAGSAVPAAEELAAMADKFAASVSASVHGSTLTAYVGPVLFEGDAAGQLFAKFFAAEAASPRPSWSEFGQELQMGGFYNRLGLRVMSALFTVTDNPLAREYNGKGLVGYYAVDSEGVPASTVTLVRKGKLADQLMSRAPTKERYQSNGHGRANAFSLAQGAASNLFFTPSATVPDSELKAKLIALCRDYDLEFGILVRDAADFSGDMELYKVYAADGREEPLRGLRFDGASSRLLRDIAAAGAVLNAYNTMVNDVPVSIIAPSVLVSEAELKAVDTKPEKLPYLNHPYFGKK